MFKNGKIFGKIGIIDIIAIIIIVGVVAGTIYKFSSPETSVSSGKATILYTLKIEGVRTFTFDFYHVGDPCFDRKTDENIGEIKAVRKEPFLARTVKNDGTILMAERPDLITIYVDIETSGNETNAAYFSNGTYELKAGSEVPLITKWIEVNGFIDDVKTV